MRIDDHECLEITPGKICLSFKTMKNIKIADIVLTMNSFYD